MTKFFTKQTSLKLSLLPLLVMMFFAMNITSMNAQLTGTKNIPGDYATLALAITDLNTQGVGTGGVLLNVLSGNPETAPANTGYYITATGTMSNPIIITGNSNIITASTNTAGGSMDAVFKIVGGDYITIQNFSIIENAANTVTATGATNTMTEAGVLIIHASATDGAQNNSILNNTINLNATYANSVGILSTSSSTTTNAAPGANTSLDATSTAGTNSNNTIKGNTIANVAFGVYFICPPITATVFETGNIIGASGGANVITYGNNTASTALWNRSVAASSGIIMRNGAGNTIAYNVVNNIATMNIATLGINISSGTVPVGVTYTSTISNNKVTLVNTISAMTGIDFGHGIATGTIVGNNDTVNITQTAAAATAAALIGIKGNYSNATNTLNANVVTFTQSQSVGATTSALTGINQAGLGTTINAIGNKITVKQNAPTGAGTYGSGAITYLSESSSSTTINATNNDFNTTGSTIRSIGTCLGITCEGTAGFYNLTSNSFVIDRVAASGTITGISQSTGPSNVADSVSNNIITFTNLAGTSVANGISYLGGPSAAGIKTIHNNTIAISGTNTGTTTGLIWGYSAGARISSNNINISCAAPTVNGISGNSTSAGASNGIVNNTLSLTSSTTSPTSMIGINCANTGPYLVSNNTFTTLSFSGIITGAPVVSGIAVSVGTGNNITNNTINNITVGAATSTANPVIDGILLSGGVSTNVFKNKIHGITSNCTGATGVVNGVRISGGTTNNVYNNLIGGLSASASTNPDAIRGISITSTTTVTTHNIYYNTVYLSGSGGANFGGSGVYHITSTTATTSTLNLRNNIIVNALTPSGTGLAVAYRRSLGTALALSNYASTSNTNLFYAGTPGVANLIYADGTSTAQTMAAYKAGVFTAGTVAPRDANSVSENPTFLSTVGSNANFLHIDPTVATQIESGGSNIATYTDDYDGNARNASTPDIGADEGAFTLADFSGPSITYTNLTNTSCTMNRVLTSTITDPSIVNTTSGTLPRIYYKKSTDNNTVVGNTSADNGWKYVEASNSTSPFNFTINVSIINGGSVTVGEIVQYFVVAQDQAATPNIGINSGTFTAVPSNVNLTSAAFPMTGTINSYTIIAAGLSGTVNVGATETYKTLSETGAGGLFNAINALGLTGNTTVNLMDAAYTETGAIALNSILTSGCASGTFTLTIKPNTTSVITSSIAAGAPIKLNGADGVTIDGSNSGGTDRSLTIKNTSTTTTGNAVIWLASPATGNGATNNTIKNCIIEGASSTTTFTGVHIGGSSAIGIATAGLELNNNNTINNNLFRKTQYGATLFGWQATTPDLNNVISNNNFGTAVAGEGFDLAGINADRQSSLIVSGNEIQNISSITGTNKFGIRLLDFKNGQCFNNYVHDIAYTSTSTPKIYGIAITSSTYTTAGNPSNALVYNNLITKITSSGASGVWNVTGLLASAGFADKYYFNTVNLNGQINNSTTGLSAAFANGDGNFPTVCTNIDVSNNIFNVEGTSGGAAGNVWAYYTAATTLAGSTLNYNDLSCTATGAINNIGRLNAVNYTTLTAWQTATAQEANSISVQPIFVSASNPHLNTVNVNTAINAAATPIAGITTDYDGNTRNATTPDLGADEFIPVVGNDMSTTSLVTPPLQGCRTPSESISVKVTNTNSLPIDFSLFNMEVKVIVTGAGSYTNSVVISTGTLAPGASQTVFLPGTLNMSATGTYNFKLINVTGNDVNAANDTINVVLQNQTLGGTYAVGTGGDYTTLTSAVSAYNNASCLTGPVVFELIDSLYSTLETFPITVNNHGQASSVNTLTIKPFKFSTGTRIFGNNTSLIKLDAADYVTIDGSKIGSTDRTLTIENGSTATSTVLWNASNALDSATNNTFKNLIVMGGSSTGAFVTIVSCSGSTLGGTAEHQNTNFVAQNNRTMRAQYGIAVAGNAGLDAGVVVTQNDISSTNNADAISFRGIFMSNTKGAQITLNTINNIQSTGAPSGMILVADTSLNCSKNIITNVITSGTNPTGITVSTGVVNSTFNANKIDSITYTGTSGYGGKGFDINTGNPNSNLLLTNNLISRCFGDGWSSLLGDALVGIRIGATGGLTSTTGGVKLYNNTVSLSGTKAGNTSGSVTAALYLSSTATNIELLNNILSNTYENTAATDKNYAINSASTTNANLLAINYNDYYVGTVSGVLGSLNATDATTLTAIQTAFGSNANSINVQPIFNSVGDVHLFVGTAGNALLNNTATPLVSVPLDFDGDTRNATNPDFGADEFTPLVCIGNAGGTSSAAANNFCGSGATTISATGYDIGLGIHYRWQKSTDNVTFTDLTNDSIPMLLATGTLGDTTYFRLKVTCDNTSGTGFSTVATVNVAELFPTSTTGATICGINQTASLSAVKLNATDSLYWYTAPTGGSSFASGTTITTPLITAFGTTNFYVSEVTGTVSGFNLGETVGSGFSSLSDYGMYFSTTNAAVIDSVSIYPSTAGTLNVQLRDNTNAVVDTKTFTINSSDISTTVPLRLALNFNVPANTTGWNIYYPTLSINRASGSYAYPYTNSGFSITGNTLDGNNITGGTRYYFFDWRVTSFNITCQGGRVAVPVTANTAPTITASASSSTICKGSPTTLSVTSSNDPNYKYVWTPGTLNGAMQTVSPTVNTIYTVTALDTTTGPNATCSSTATVPITVNPTPIFTMTNDTTVCALNPVQLAATVINFGAKDYVFAASSSTFAPLTSATAVDVIEDDDALSGTIPIGFSFAYNGVLYSNVFASSNGWLSFNPASLTSTAAEQRTNILANPPASLLPMIAPLWDDLDAADALGDASYKTTGTAPNRVFTFEWLNWEWNWLADAPVLSYQVKLYEGTNKIEFAYSQGTAAVNTGGASIGITTATGNFLSLNNTSASPTASSTTETTTLSVKPATDQLYTFIPPVYNYNWTPATELSATNIYNPISTPTASITYKAFVTIPATGCTDSADVAITITPDPISGVISGDTSLCGTNTTTLTSSGNTGGTWTSGTTTVATVNASSGLVTAVGAGTSTISYSVTNSCGTSTATRVVVVAASCGAGSDTILVYTGWNLISIDVAPIDSSIDTVFQDVLPITSIITSFDAVNGATYYDPALPAFSTLFNIERGYGYWINVSADDTIIVHGPKLDTTFGRPLAAQYNIVSYLPQPTQPVDVYFNQVITNTNATLIASYDNINGATSYDPALPAFATLTDCVNSYGFEVYLNNAQATWRASHDDFGNERTSKFNFVRGKTNLTSMSDAEEVYVVTADGKVRGSMKLMADGNLRPTPIYGDNIFTKDVSEGIAIGAKLYLKYKDQVIDAGITFQGDRFVLLAKNANFDLAKLPKQAPVKELALFNTYPNPFDQLTNIEFSLPSEMHIQVNIYDSKGALVDKLIEKNLPKGIHRYQWDASNNASGLYYVRLIADDKEILSRSMNLIK